jgi:tetratricopeptide (TPR) repeat protein
MDPTRKRKEVEPLEMGGVVIHPGSRIGSFVYLREVGSGGMARVILAKDPEDKLVALKVLRRNRFKTGLARFRREFHALSRITHPNVIRVLSYGDLFGHPYIAMEYVDGPDLHTLIRSFRGWPPERRWQRCEEILVDLCSALSAVHRRGLVHRDLKPSNVLIHSDGTCKLTDFGIVKDLEPSSDPHLSTTLVGTWAYASPEQITGAPVDARSDLYSLGVILFAMLTGKRPFVANDMAGYLALHRDRPAPAPRDIVADVPEHLDEICRRLLQKAVRDRFASADEILFRLEAEERVPEPSLASGWEPPVVGRDLEEDALANAVSALTARRGGLLVLEGEDGSGRSRLLDLATQRARVLGIRFQRVEFQPDTPVFAALHGIGRYLAKELGDAAPAELHTALDTFARGDARAGDSRYALYDGLRDAFELALEDAPLLLMFDDVHLARPRELDLVTYLLRNTLGRSGLPLLAIVTLRAKANPLADELASGDRVGVTPQEMTAGPLSREDIASLVVDLVGDTLGARLLAERLHNETEGNAYFVTEFLRALLAAEKIVEVDGKRTLTLEPEVIRSGHLEIPIGVRQVMKARLAAVSAGDRPVLEVLAVAGREVDLDVLLDVLAVDEDEVLDTLDRLLAAGIVRERRAGEAIFHTVSHRKFADVVYRDLDADRRSELHRKMAEALELHYAQDPSALELVGDHYRKAGESGRAYRYLVAAARRLSERSLVHEAWELSERAAAIEATALADLPPADYRSFRRDNHSVRANVHYVRGEWADAEKTYRVVLDLAEEDDDRREACEARLRIATVLRRRGKLDESRKFAEQALEASRRLHYRQGVAEALHCMAALAWGRGDLDECERMANEGLLIAQGGQLADRRAELLLALTVAQATRGHLAAATSGLTEAEGIFRELRKKRQRCLALANIAELLTWQGEPMQARQRAHVAVVLAKEIEYKLGRTAAIRATAVAALDLGLYEEAQNGLHTSLQLARQLDASEEILASLVPLMQLSLERGDAMAARHHGARGLEVGDVRDPESYVPLLQAHLARALAASSPEDGRAFAMAADKALPSLPVPRRTQVQLALAWAWLELGDLQAARVRARAVVQTAGSRGFRLRSLEARALMAHLTEGEDSRTHRAVGQELVRDFTNGLSAEMARAFRRRPFIQMLDEPAGEDAPPDPTDAPSRGL